MADVEFSHGMGAYGRNADPQEKPNNSLVTATNIAGACLSLALIAGVGVWGYKLMVRDVSGIPVVRAAEGEMRVRPENPGGQLAQHQGLAVNAIAAEGVAEGPVDQVILAPRAITLSDEDQPVAAAPEPRSAESAVPSSDATIENTVNAVQQSEIDALVAELTEGTVPMVQVPGARTVSAPVSAQMSDVTTTAAIGEELVPEPQPAVLGAPVAKTPVIESPSVRASIRPRVRPKDISAMIQPAAYTPAVAAAEIDPNEIPSGTRLAQLGAFESAEVARSEWDRLEARFGSYLQDKSRVVQQAQSNGRTFYRLRAMGFVDLNDTRRFCSAFKAEGVDCIPVQVR